MEIKEIMKAMRKEAKMTQREFSEYFGIPLRTVEDWERGVRQMPDYVLRIFAYKLRVEGFIQQNKEWEDFKKESKKARYKKAETDKDLHEDSGSV